MEQKTQAIPIVKVYSDKVIYGVSFFGGPLAAGYIIAQNYKAFDEKEKYKKTLLVSIAVTALLFSAIFLIPDIDRVPRYIIPLFYTAFASWFMKARQANKIATHIAAGGKIYSAWRAFLVTIIGLVCMTALIFPMAYISAEIKPSTEIVIQNYGRASHELFYDPSTINKDEVKGLGEKLVLVNCLDSTEAMALFIGKKENTFTISFPFNGPAWESPEIIAELTGIQKKLKAFYPKNNIELLFCDETLDVKKIMK